MSDRKQPSRSTGRRITEAELDARTPEEERRRWQGKLFFDTSKQSVEEIATDIRDDATFKDE